MREKKFRSTKRPKWHLAGGEVNNKWDRLGDGTLVLVVRKPRMTGRHQDADPATDFFLHGSRKSRLLLE